MKQIIQNLSNGKTSLIEVPKPNNLPGHLLISTVNSVVSSGTERTLVDFGKGNYIDKARQQPEKVLEVLEKIKTDGLASTLEAVKSKLEQPLSLGYCNSGIVLDSKVPGFLKGDRVVSNGSHAEIVRVPKNLCCKIPDEVDDESASFTVLGSIALQGVRLANPTIGETVVVFGLGLVGLLTVQILKANGCRVVAIDFDIERCRLAGLFGAATVCLSENEDPIKYTNNYTRGRGADAVIIAAATKSDDVVHQAATISRKRGRIILVGVVGLNLKRDDFYEKELTFQVSSSYGPGRYDLNYENEGHDYPVGFVRWTEQRNFEAVLDLMALGLLNLKPLISHRLKIEQVEEAYGLLENPSALGILFSYKEVNKNFSQTISLEPRHHKNSKNNSVLAVFGAGNYASRVLIPAFKNSKSDLHTLVATSGLNSSFYGRKLGFSKVSTRPEDVFEEELINTVAIATRHDSHSELVISSLRSGKNVFVEKPLALDMVELEKIKTTYIEENNKRENSLLLMVGFNRRFSPLIIKMKELLEKKKIPKVIIMTINAGFIPSTHWTQDRKVGGGRIVGEACHFIDLISFLVGLPVETHQIMNIGINAGEAIREDKASITVSFADGSFGTIHYLANGGKAYPKERIEVFCDNSVLEIDNFKSLKGFNWKGFRGLRLLRQNKGSKECISEFNKAVREGAEAPISSEEIFESSKASIEIAEKIYLN